MNAFAEHYASLPEEDISRLSLEMQSLTPEAQDALRLEMERRQIPAVIVQQKSQAAVPVVEKSSGALRRFGRNFFIFIACDAVYFVIVALLVARVQGVDIEQVSASMTKMFLNLSLLLALVTSKFFVPKRLKTVWFIGAATPLVALLFVMLSH
jgi:hypothetical protein